MFIRVFFIPNYHKSKGNHDVPIYLPLSIAEKRCKYYFLPNLYYVYAPYNCDGDVVAWLRRSYTSAVRKSLAKSPCPPLLCTGITKNASFYIVYLPYIRISILPLYVLHTFQIQLLLIFSNFISYWKYGIYRKITIRLIYLTLDVLI